MLFFSEFSITRWVGTKRKDNFFFSLFLGIFQPILAWNEAIIIFVKFFCYFFWNFLLRVVYERIETIIFIFFLLHPPSTYGGKKWSHNGIFNFLEIFCYFFWIFNYALGRNETERQYLLSFFLGLFLPILALNEAILAFFIFFNFFAIFLEFSIVRQVGTKRNDNFCVLPFSSSFNLWWLEMEPLWYFLIFLNFFAIFLEFSITR